MGRDPADQFPLDTGDLYIAVVNDNFELQEWHQISFNDPTQTGGMRPWFDVYEDQVILGYDKQNSLYLYSLKLNLDAFDNGYTETEPSSEPSEEPSSEPSGEPSTDPTPSDPKANDGCGSNAAILPFLLLPLAYLRKINLHTESDQGK